MAAHFDRKVAETETEIKRQRSCERVAAHDDQISRLTEMAVEHAGHADRAHSELGQHFQRPAPGGSGAGIHRSGGADGASDCFRGVDGVNGTARAGANRGDESDPFTAYWLRDRIAGKASLIVYGRDLDCRAYLDASDPGFRGRRPPDYFALDDRRPGLCHRLRGPCRCARKLALTRIGSSRR